MAAGEPSSDRSAAAFAVLAATAVLGCAGVTSPAVPASTGVVEVYVRVSPDAKTPLQVSMQGPLGKSGGATLRMAATAVGSYAPSPFGAFVGDLSAWDASGNRLAVTRTGGGLWQVEPGGALARVAYSVDTAAGEAKHFLTSTHRREGHMLLSGYATFLLVEGAMDLPYRVRFDLPRGWQVAWSLPEASGAYLARDAFELLDEPAMLGERFQSIEVRSSIPGWIHLYADPQEQAGSQLSELARSYEAAAAGVSALGLPPLERPYHVFYELLPRAGSPELGWALEHGSSFYGSNYVDEPVPQVRLAYHIAHHMVHAWLPRRLFTDRLRPRRLVETNEPTDFLWFAEGFAQYIAFVGLARAGQATPEKILGLLVRRFAEPGLAAARGEPRSMAERSRVLSTGADAEHWSYGYASGGLLAMWLDEQLRAHGERGLPEILLRLLSYCGSHPEGISEEGFEKIFEQASGLDVTETFARHVRGTEPLPVTSILAGAGIAGGPGGFVVLPADALSPEARRFRAAAFGSLR